MLGPRGRVERAGGVQLTPCFADAPYGKTNALASPAGLCGCSRTRRVPRPIGGGSRILVIVGILSTHGAFPVKDRMMDLLRCSLICGRRTVSRKCAMTSQYRWLRSKNYAALSSCEFCSGCVDYSTALCTCTWFSLAGWQYRTMVCHPGRVAHAPFHGSLHPVFGHG